MLAASDPAILPSDFIKALVAYGFNLMLLGRQLELVDVAEEAHTLARTYEDDRLLPSAIGIYGIAHAFQLMPDILSEIEEAIRICRENDFFDELAGNLTLVGGSYFLAGDVEKGEPYLEEAFRIRLDLGGPPGIAEVANTRGGMAWLQGDWENARTFTLKALEQYEVLGSRQAVNMCRSRLAHIHRALGEIEEAESIYGQTIHAWQELGNLPAVAHQLECFAFLRIAEGNHPLGARLIGAAKAARERLNAPSFSPPEIADMEQAMAQLVEAMGGDEREAFMNDGARLSLDEAISLATGEFTE
jgi:tetratricopeptide (TPR) repeat protein